MTGTGWSRWGTTSALTGSIPDAVPFATRRHRRAGTTSRSWPSCVAVIAPSTCGASDGGRSSTWPRRRGARRSSPRAARVAGCRRCLVAVRTGRRGRRWPLHAGRRPGPDLLLVRSRCCWRWSVRQARRPDRGIWWAVPLVAVWGNLHGAVLLGVCVLGAYLVVDRLRQRPVESIAVGAAYPGRCARRRSCGGPRSTTRVFDNVSAQRAEGLWARPALGVRPSTC